MSNMPKVATEVPEGPWMRRLRESNWIWLVKEGQYASVLFPWQPPEPGYMTGRLCLCRSDQRNGDLYRGETQVWFVGSRGEGLDGKQLIVPCEGHLPETLAEIIGQPEQELLMTIELLRKRVSGLMFTVECISTSLVMFDQRIGTLERTMNGQT